MYINRYVSLFTFNSCKACAILNGRDFISPFDPIPLGDVDKIELMLFTVRADTRGWHDLATNLVFGIFFLVIESLLKLKKKYLVILFYLFHCWVQSKKKCKTTLI